MARADGKRVLVIDDDPDLLALVASVLEDEGYEVRTAPDGREALVSVESAMPDVILLDLKMPVMSGPEFAQAFRARYDSRVPIVVLTAADDARKRAAEIHADGLISKPFDLDELIDTVRRHTSPPSP